MSKGQVIEIRHAEPDDYKAVHIIFCQPGAYSGTLQIPHTSAEIWKNRLSIEHDNGFALVALIAGEIVGTSTLMFNLYSARRRHSAMLGMAVHDDWQGQGVGSALLAATLDKTDNWLNILRVELTVYTDNQAAIGLYEKYGFKTEGKLEKYAYRNGEFVDSFAMARLKD